MNPSEFATALLEDLKKSGYSLDTLSMDNEVLWARLKNLYLPDGLPMDPKTKHGLCRQLQDMFPAILDAMYKTLNPTSHSHDHL